MTKKQILSVISFCLIASMMLLLLCDLFEQENSNNMDKRFTTFRHLEEDTVDVVYVGTSGVDRYWIGAKAYEEYGMTVYPMATESMPTWLLPIVIDEIYTYQNPELIIMDTRTLYQANTSASQMDVRARRVLEGMNFFSINRIKGAFKAMESIHTAFEEEPSFDLSLLLPFIKYHPKWSEDDYTISKNLGNKEHQYLGFYMSGERSAVVEPIEPKNYADPNATAELDAVTEAAIYDLFDYIKEKDINILFVDSPQVMDEDEKQFANRAFEILEEEGFEYLEFYDESENGKFTFDLSLETDFYNEGHVNFYGAEKYTAVLSQYMDENYDLPDRRGDENVAKDWDGVYDKIKDKIAQYEEKQSK